jgi:integrase
MLNVSFYLLTPDARSQSHVYVSISNKIKRLRFATGQSFLTTYCNIRKKKGKKELVKKNSEFYFDYTSTLNSIRDNLIRIEMELSKEKPCELEQVRDAYYIKSGKMKDETILSFYQAFDKFVLSNQGSWGDGTQKHFTTLKNHLIEYEKIFGEISLNDINEQFWNGFRDDYFVKKKKFGNATTNKNLKKFKQFIKFSIKKQFIKTIIDFDDLKHLDEIEPFKIALKEKEVLELLKLDLSHNDRLEKVRDLFALEIMTGQRYSDLPKVLDKKNISETNIQIYQQKTGEKVQIPLHPKLKKHLLHISTKYTKGLPTISNQKFNEYLKEICKQAGFEKEHSWVTLTGKKKINQSDFRYNLVTSHTGRRTFCTLSLKRKISPEFIMKVTGHRKYDQFREYVKVDDEDLDNAFEGLFTNEKD